MKLLGNNKVLWTIIVLLTMVSVTLYIHNHNIAKLAYSNKIASVETPRAQREPQKQTPQVHEEPQEQNPSPPSEMDPDLDFSKIPNQISETDYYAKILTRRIMNFNGTGAVGLLAPCENEKIIANSCDGRCLRKKRPKDIRERVAQLVEPKKLRIKPDSLEIIKAMREKVEGQYDVIIVTAGSSNHYRESQALIQNLHSEVFPWLKNFTFLYYDLGLSKGERHALKKYCKCQVLDYPFEKFPPLLRHRTCYTWKPMIIKAHYQQANLLFWTDASMRFPNESRYLQSLFARTREHGVQVHGVYYVRASLYTNRTMFHFFGDEACVYRGMTHGQPSCILFARDRFVDRVMIEPWVACAMDTGCMCLTPGKGPIDDACHEAGRVNKKDHDNGNGTFYGMCHLYDQSAISIIIHKLYQEFYRNITPNFGRFKVFTRRNHRTKYFPEQSIEDFP